MAVNLTPQYHEAEERFRKAKTPAERLSCLEEMWVQLPKHKASEKLQAQLKTKLSRAREDLENAPGASKVSSGLAAKFPRQGAGQVVLVGPPNSGKSQFLAAFTEAKPEIAPYPFTTRQPQAGMMTWQEVRVQLIDTPPITSEVLDSAVLSLVRQADSCLLFTDLSDDDGVFQTLSVLEKLKDFKTHLVGEPPEGNEDWTLSHVRTMLVGTRAGCADIKDRLEVVREMLPGDMEFLLAELLDGKEAYEPTLREAVWKSLRMIRVYPKKPGKPVNPEDVIPLDQGSTVQDMAFSIHNELGEKVKSARLWGPSATVDGAVVSRSHVLMDCDTVELQS
jgi:ribosome-interacting GTPase 1